MPRRRVKLWTNRERQRLAASYAHATWPELLTLLPGRSRGQIEQCARRLGLRRGSADATVAERRRRRLDRAHDYLAGRAAAIAACPGVPAAAALCGGAAACGLINTCITTRETSA